MDQRQSWRLNKSKADHSLLADFLLHINSKLNICRFWNIGPNCCVTVVVFQQFTDETIDFHRPGVYSLSCDHAFPFGLSSVEESADDAPSTFICRGRAVS